MAKIVYELTKSEFLSWAKEGKFCDALGNVFDNSTLLSGFKGFKNMTPQEIRNFLHEVTMDEENGADEGLILDSYFDHFEDATYEFRISEDTKSNSPKKK